MSGCAKFENLMNESLDGALSAAEARVLDEHLASCTACRTALEESRVLLARARALPKGILPPRDLWPGIEDRVREVASESAPAASRRAAPSRATWILAAAAALMGVAGAAVILSRRPVPVRFIDPLPQAPSPSVQRVALSEMDRGYGRAKNDFLQVIEERRDLIKPETRAIVDENLALLDQAVHHIKAALDQDPANQALMDLLRNTYRHQQELLKRAATLPAHA